MSRKPIIAGNWKMNKSHLEAIHTVEELRNRLDPGIYSRRQVVVVPPFTALRSVQTVIESDDLEIELGAQNMHWEPSGAYTGEVSPAMLNALRVKYVIIGHSERREYFFETDEMVNNKLKAAFASKLTPIMCIGETLREREEGFTNTKVGTQVLEGMKGLTAEQVASMVIAYEPIWAIGTGRTATAADAQATIQQIRQYVREIFEGVADDVRIQYGGSVNPGNVDELMAQPDIDGALVGGASLDPVQFARIVHHE
ncbi:MAG: triose-phosphate isomerase [Actinomycetota bacterium]